jgi:DNA-3-methyladenine glycosylase
LKLPVDFYRRDDVVGISRELLGKVLCTRVDGTVTTAVITETEAYAGVDDKASHAFGDRRTPRTEPMYGPGGIAYVYLCYGIHHLFNVVTNVTGVPHAVLIRAARPLDGMDTIRARRRGRKDRLLMAGPGTVSQALGIHTTMTGTDLSSNRIWIEDRGIDVADEAVTAGPRIGVDYAGEDATRPYRFVADLAAG